MGYDPLKGIIMGLEVSSFVLCLLILFFFDVSSNNLITLEDVIPPNYDMYEAPTVDGKPVNVYLMLDIMDVDSIDEGNMEFKVQMYLKEFWQDPRLKLDVYTKQIMKSGSNKRVPKDMLAKIWTPDAVFDNAKSGSLFEVTVPNTGVFVTSSGDLLRNSRYNLRVTCQMDLHLYPMDTQQCFMKIVLFSHSDEKALLNWVSDDESPYKSSYPGSISYKQNIQPLKHVIFPPATDKFKEVWATGNYTYLYANFTFTRRLSASIVIVYIPSTLVVCLSWTSFWLDVRAAPARITLGVTSFLTLATQVVQAHSYLPPLNYMTAMDIWLFVCIITVFCSIVEFATSYHIFQSKQVKTTDAGPNGRPIWQSSETLKSSHSRRIQTAFRAKVSGDLKVEKNLSNATLSEETIMSSEVSDKNAIDSFCRKLFPSSFFLFVLVYWIVFNAIS